MIRRQMKSGKRRGIFLKKIISSQIRDTPGTQEPQIATQT